MFSNKTVILIIIYTFLSISLEIYSFEFPFNTLSLKLSDRTRPRIPDEIKYTSIKSKLSFRAISKEVYFRSHMSSFDEFDDKPQISFKVLGIAIVGLLGIFGTSFLGTIQSTIKEVATQQSPTTSLKNSAGEESRRGSMTRLTRREINNKISQVPIFYAINNIDGIYTENSIGYLFSDKKDADKYAEKRSLRVSADSLNSIFYTMVQKKTKTSLLEGISAKSDISATYKFVPSSEEIENCPSDWKLNHQDDIPLFRVIGLAFSKEEGLELPLFIRKIDALESYNRLQSKNKETDKVSGSSEPNIQVTSLLDIVQLFSTGGFESRALEIYPSMEAIDSARKIMMK